MLIVNKTCISCQHHLHGRTDKKFCNDYCRNTYNNQLNSASNQQVRNINHHLRKNRRILESFLLPSKQIIKVARQKLFSKGFAFTYFTHIHTNKKGSVYHFCYEYGYLISEGDAVMIIKKKIE
jgi:hypothetical protein